MKENQVCFYWKMFRSYEHKGEDMILGMDLAEWINYDIKKVDKLVEPVDQPFKIKKKLKTDNQEKEQWLLSIPGVIMAIEKAETSIAKVLSKFMRNTTEAYEIFGERVEKVELYILLRAIKENPELEEKVVTDLGYQKGTEGIDNIMHQH